MKWTVRIVIVSCLVAWVAFFASGCADVDTPLPIDGQVYACTATDVGTGELVLEAERCGPWDDATVPAWEIADEYKGSRAVAVDCQGTRRACAWEP